MKKILYFDLIKGHEPRYSIEQWLSVNADYEFSGSIISYLTFQVICLMSWSIKTKCFCTVNCDWIL